MAGRMEALAGAARRCVRQSLRGRRQSAAPRRTTLRRRRDAALHRARPCAVQSRASLSLRVESRLFREPAMTEPTPATPQTEEAKEAKKRLREKVDKLLAKDPCKSTGSIVLNGRTLKYRAEAAFVPVTAGGLDEKRGE